jgi:hypothetical protein
MRVASHIRIGLLAAVAATSFVVAGKPARAGQPPTQALNPPPPAFYTCMATGAGTICHGSHTDEHFAGFDGTCPQGFDILENGYLEEDAARYYDGNGNLVRRVLHDRYPAGNALNILYNSQTGTSVPYSGDFTETDTFAVPGDFGSVTSTYTGNLYTANAPGSGILIHDVGLLTFAPDGSVVEDHGPKMLFSGDTAILCAALS